MSLVDRVEALYGLQDRVESDRELLEAPLLNMTGKTGKEISPTNELVALLLEGAKDEIYCYFKPLNGVDATTADSYGQTRDSVTLAECAAWRLAHAIGGTLAEIVVPQVLRKFDDIDPRAPGALARRHPGKTNSTDPFTEVRDACLAAAFFDALCGQQDRNKNNWLWYADTGAFKLIDHGYAFARPNDITVNLRFSRWRWSKNEEKLTESEVDAIERMLGSGDLFGLATFLEEERAAAFDSRARRMLESGELIPVGEL